MRNSVLEFFCDVRVATRYWHTANSLLVSKTLLTNFVMKSRDILSPDTGPGIRTQDSVVTSGTTTSYATEDV